MGEIESLFSQILDSQNVEDVENSFMEFFYGGVQKGFSTKELLEHLTKEINKVISVLGGRYIEEEDIADPFHDAVKKALSIDPTLMQDVDEIVGLLEMFDGKDSISKSFTEVDQDILKELFDKSSEEYKRQLILIIDDDQLKEDYIEEKFFKRIENLKAGDFINVEDGKTIYSSDVEHIASTMSDDAHKMKIIERLLEKQLPCEKLISALSTDELKIQYLDRLFMKDPRFPNQLTFKDILRIDTVCQTIESDEFKTNLIDIFSSRGIETKSFIKMISDDDTKIDYFQKYLEQNDIFEYTTDDEMTFHNLAKTLRSDQSKMKFINKYIPADSEYASVYLMMLKSDELKIDIIKAGIGMEEPKEEWGSFFKGDDFVEMIHTSLPELFNSIKRKDIIPAEITEHLSSQILGHIGGVEPLQKKERELLKTPREELGLPKGLTFGVELEAEGLDTFCTRMIMENLKRKSPWLENWGIKNDNSVPNGTEVVSPILTDTEENMYQLQFVSEIMQTVGFETKDTCGGHIHYGADFLDIGDGGKKGLKALRSIWKESEELFYKMSNGEGKVIRPTASHYAGKIEDKIDETINIDSQEEYEMALSQMQETRYYGINFDNMKVGGKNTIEFRMPNGTIDPKEIRENIFLFGRLMTVSREMAQNPELYAERMDALKQRDVSEAEKMEALLGLLFEDEKDRSIYRRRWESVRENSIYDEFSSSVPTFVRGDYSLREVAKGMSEEVTPEEIQDFVNDVKETTRDTGEKPKEEGR